MFVGHKQQTISFCSKKHGLQDGGLWQYSDFTPEIKCFVICPLKKSYVILRWWCVGLDDFNHLTLTLDLKHKHFRISPISELVQ